MSIKFTPREVTAYYTARVPSVKQRNAPKWDGLCPVHHGKDPNFAVKAATGEAYCHSQCKRGWDIVALEMELTGADFKTAKAEVFRLVGRAETVASDGTAGGWHEIARYAYVDQNGKLVFEVVRYLKPDSGKAFKQRRPDGRGGFVWNLDGLERVPYRLPRVLKAQTIYLAEGEKDCAALEEWGLVASCNPGGSGSSQLFSGWTDYFRGKDIVILPDNDGPGRTHAAAVAAALLNVAASVRIVELPGLPAKGDVTDWRDAGGTFERFRKLTEAGAPIDAAALAELRAQWGLADEEPNHAAARVNAADDWPKLEPIQSELPPVQSFSEELLPDSFRPLVADVAERMQVPMDYPAIVAVLCLAGAVNRRAMIQPKVNDIQWVEVANLWGAIVGPPGVMKTPVIQAITRPLVAIQAEWREDYEEQMAEYERAVEESGLTKSAWKQQFIQAHKKPGTATPERPPDAPAKPKLRRLIVNDATFEALHQTMSENPAGVFQLRDELAGWLAGLERAGHEQERAFHLESWNGKNPFTMDRIGRGTIHVPACCESLFGGIQPGRLRSYMADTLRDGPSNDGLMQRISVIVWPDLNSWEYVDLEPNAIAAEAAVCVLRKLVELDADNPARFRFARDAQELFVEWLTELETKVRGDELHPAICGHLSKYRKLMPVLALLFELADRASSVGFDGSLLGNSQNFVSLEHAREAAAWCEYLESHARRVYSCIATPQLRAARELADKIKQRKVGTDGSFASRDVYLKGWSGLDSPEAVKQAADVLEDAGWLRVVTTYDTGGRPRVRYIVSPKVWE